MDDERPFLTWYDLERFEVGAIYVHVNTDLLLEFIGVATLPELGEKVAVFRYVDGGGCLIATKVGHDQGETFTTFGQAVEHQRELGE
jgi:hypothetical protein